MTNKLESIEEIPLFQQDKELEDLIKHENYVAGLEENIIDLEDSLKIKEKTILESEKINNFLSEQNKKQKEMTQLAESRIRELEASVNQLNESIKELKKDREIWQDEMYKKEPQLNKAVESISLLKSFICYMLSHSNDDRFYRMYKEMIDSLPFKKARKSYNEYE